MYGSEDEDRHQIKMTGISMSAPWCFGTTNVRSMIREAWVVAENASPDSISEGVTEVDVIVAVNNLRHAADELERSLLEMKYGVYR